PVVTGRARAAGWSPSRSAAWRRRKTRSTPRRVRPGVRARGRGIPGRRLRRSPTRWTLAEPRGGYEPERGLVTSRRETACDLRTADLAPHREACELAAGKRSGSPSTAACGLLENLANAPARGRAAAPLPAGKLPRRRRRARSHLRRRRRGRDRHR